MSVLMSEVGDVDAGSLEDLQPQRTQHGDEGEACWLSESQAAVNIASNYRCVNRRVGDYAATFGRRTYSAGECSRTPSMTVVR